MYIVLLSLIHSSRSVQPMYIYCTCTSYTCTCTLYFPIRTCTSCSFLQRQARDERHKANLEEKIAECKCPWTLLYLYTKNYMYMYMYVYRMCTTTHWTHSCMSLPSFPPSLPPSLPPLPPSPPSLPSFPPFPPSPPSFPPSPPSLPPLPPSPPPLFLGDPNKDENTEGDPFKTLFVGRIVSPEITSQCCLWECCVHCVGVYMLM